MASRYHGELEVALEDARAIVDAPIQVGDWVLLGKLREAPRECDIVPLTVDDMRHLSMYSLRTFIMEDWWYGAEWDYELWHICANAS